MKASFISAATVLLAARGAAISTAADICTAHANGFEAIDDAPAINDALRQCGNGGTIILPAGEFYSIASTIDFSPCRNCDFQIEGSLIFATSQLYNFASRDKPVFSIKNATGVRIRSVTGTGVIDGNAVPWYERRNWNPRIDNYPFVHITDQSSNISVSNLHFKNIMDRVFLLQGNSTDLHFSNLNITAEGINPLYAGFNNVGFAMGEVKNVTILDTQIDFRARSYGVPSNNPTGNCVAFDHGTDSVLVENMTCRRAWLGAVIMFENIVPRLGPNEKLQGVVSNIRVSNFTFDGDHATGVQSWFNGYEKVARNIIWENVYIESSAAPAEFDQCYSSARSTSYIPMCYQRSTWDAKGLVFRQYRGKVGTPPTDPNWGKVNNLSTIEARFEDWVNTA